MAATNILPILVVCLFASLITAVPVGEFNSESSGLTLKDLSSYLETLNEGEVPDFEIVNPWPVRRVRRSSEFLNEDDDDEELDQQSLEYIFNAFEEEFHLVLQPALDLFSDSLLIQHTRRDGSTLRPASKHCYYQGTSLYHNGSATFASTCSGGVTATIRTEYAEYHVQPLKKDHALKFMADPDEPKAHIMHKLSRTPSKCAMEGGNLVSEEVDRQKRDVESRGNAYETKYVEVLVVADETVKQEYGEDTEFYLLSMLNQVAGLYKDKTLGADIKLHIRKIRILEEALPNLEITDNIETSLQQFCAWQRGENADISVLISRRDMAFGGHSDVTGNSFDIGTACDENRRCSIAEDHGPNGLVFTVAHEIAHLLGVYHDGLMNGCEDDGFVMSSSDSGGKEAFKWSECSRNNILDWLKSESSSCLDNVPPAPNKYFLSKIPLPGNYFDADFQCRSIHDDETATVAQSIKDSEDICGELSCDYNGFFAVSNNIPPLDGTSCGHEKACITGWCMDLASKFDCGGGDCPPSYITGAWTTCSTQCVQNRQVLCAEVHDDGSTVLLDSSDCLGLQPVADQRCCCLTGDCSAVANLGERYQWVASTWGSCSATCGSAVQTRIVTCYDTVGGQPTDIESLCDSNLRPDTTQQCSLQNCPSTSSSYLWLLGSYGACSVTCGGGTQSRGLACYDSALNTLVNNDVCTANLGPAPSTEPRSCNTDACPSTVTYQYVAGTFGDCSVTCGDGVQSRSVTCETVSGNSVVDSSNCISAGLTPLPTTQLCNLGSCPVTTTYEYYIGPYAACTVTCGNGIQFREVYCRAVGTTSEVADTFCIQQGLEKPGNIQACSLPACPTTITTYEFTIDNWSTCSVTCGDGIQTRSVTCNSIPDNISVDDSNCINAGLTQPSTTQLCNLGNCPVTITYEYYTGLFGACSVTCGNGFQFREVYCRAVGTTTEVADTFCTQQGLEKPGNIQACSEPVCPTTTYEFTTEAWSTCSVNCGSGYQFRQVYCRENGTQTIVADSFCIAQGLVKPLPYQSCNLQPCVYYEYYTGNWQSCSATCGGGVQTRSVYCTQVSGGEAIAVSDDLCVQQSLVKPPESQVCNTGSCPVVEQYTYFAGNWEDCTVTCGTGSQTRQVLCFRISNTEIVAESFCIAAGSAKPAETQTCELSACPVLTYEYFIGSFGECSKSCEVGVQVRTVYCTQVGETTEVAESLCDSQGLTKPLEAQVCNIQDCPTYSFDLGSWGQCSTSCGAGTQTRTVTCIDESTSTPVALSVCTNEGLQIPASVQECPNQPPCPVYSFVEGQWGECTSTCGNGTQSRTITCVDTVSNAEAAMSDCITEGLVMPAAQQECPGLPACPVYAFIEGQWGSCSSSCGNGTQSRNVTCFDSVSNAEVDMSVCMNESLVMPAIEQECPGLPECTVYVFIEGPWGSCTSTCGNGTQSRSVTCVDSVSNAEVAMSVCENEGLVMPATEQECPDLPECPVYVFIEGEWQSCSSTCGTGTQSRTVTCVDIVANIQVATSDCITEGLILPATEQECPGLPACPVYVFIEGEWGSCSATCGDGTQFRNVQCVDQANSNTLVDNNLCLQAGLVAPASQQSCNVQSCEGGDVYLFITSSWGPCECATSVQRRIVRCFRLGINQLFPANDTACEALNQVRPDDTQPCVPDSSCGVWFTSEWEECSVTCGVGVRRRTVQCVAANNQATLLPDNLCTEQRPNAIEECDTAVSCPKAHYWLESPWSECSVTCGNGTRTRTTSCYTLNGVIRQVDRSLCDAEDEPEVVENCNLRPCEGVWVAHPWQPCSVTCGCGTQTRHIDCRLEKDSTEAVEMSSCEAIGEGPPTERDCNNGPCPGPYNCGNTFITETGTLQSPGYPASYPHDIDCPNTIALRPENVERERLGHIQIQFIQFQLEASLDCRYDFVEIRDVETNGRRRFCEEFEDLPFIYDSQGMTVEVNFHSDATVSAPGFIATWSLVPEEPTPTYVVGDWSECTAPCGVDEQRREVRCMLRDIEVPETDCIELGLERPADRQPCPILPPCPDYPDLCNDTILTNASEIYSPGYPANYLEDTDCVTSISNPTGCVRVSFTMLQIEGRLECAEDYVELHDDAYPALNDRFCGSPLEMPHWQSLSGSVTVRFHSDSRREGRGFHATVEFTECSDYIWLPGPWSECSASCGINSTRTRTVECFSRLTLQTTSSALCTGEMPPAEEVCRVPPCADCNQVIREPNSYIRSPNFPNLYLSDDSCEVTVSNPDQDGCVRLIFLNFDIESGPGGSCDADRLEIFDDGSEDSSITLCGDHLPPSYVSSEPTVHVNFQTDAEVVASGYEIFVRFEECSPLFLYVGNWSDCDARCDGGYRYRDIACIDTTNGNLVEVQMCPGIIPSFIEGCNQQPCQPVLCREEITESSNLIETPYFPRQYPNNEDCQANITNELGCVRVAFLYALDIEPGTTEGICDNDYIEIVDYNDDALTKRYCGNEFPDPWESSSGSVRVTFSSNDAITGAGGQAYVNFFPCPTYNWVPEPWAPCDAECDGGTRVRVVNCRSTASRDIVEDSLCTSTRPADSEPCNEQPCQVDCDMEITQSGQLFQSPNYPNEYDNNQHCHASVANDIGCVRVAFIGNFDIEAGSTEGVCDNDFVEIVDRSNDALTRRYCGDTAPAPWESSSGYVNITFHSNDAVVANGFWAYVTFQPCPTYAWVEGSWSECDVTCDGGVRTRSVTCHNTRTQTEVNDELCPPALKPAESEACNEQPCPPPSCDRVVNTMEMIEITANEYLNNRDCQITITNPSGCMILTFSRIDIEPGDTENECSNDYLEVDDLASNVEPPRFCGTEEPPNWQSTGGVVVLRFHTNDADTRSGFQVFPVFGVCPLYSWSVGQWGQCDVTCGGGTRTRSVTCQLQNQQLVADGLCTAPKPSELEVCNSDPCPGCDAVFTTQGFIQSPNYPSNYVNDLTCVTTINAPSNLCVRLSFVAFSLQPGSRPGLCDTDYVQVTDLNNRAMNDIMCGGDSRLFNSLSSDVEIVFHSDENFTDSGFQLYANFVACPQFAFIPGEWGECDVTCGGGTRTRAVECRRVSDNAVVPDALCTGSRQPTTEPCNFEECPACLEIFTEGSSTISSTNYPSAYPPNQDCVYTISNENGCVNIVFLTLDIEQGSQVGVCDNDYLRIEDANYPFLTETYCGGVIPPNWFSASGSVNITFHSNGAQEGTGFNLFQSFRPCRTYDWVAEGWGTCSVTCGIGTHSRAVECRDTITNALAPADSLCVNEKPVLVEACSDQPCVINCDETVTSNQMILSYGSPANYENDLDCVTTVTNANGCINFIFLEFDVEAGTTEGVCDNDYLMIEDINGGLSEKYCGVYSPNPSFNSVTGNVRLTFHSNSAVTSSGYRIFASFGSCPQFDWTVGQWETCSAACDGGVQTRTVECRNVQTNALASTDTLCTQTKPDVSQDCNTQPCEQYCDRALTVSGGQLTSPGYSGNYDNNENCQNNIINVNGCVRLTFADMDIQAGTTEGVCDRDYLQITDLTSSDVTLYCGSTLPSQQWLSTGSSVNALFVSDGSVTGRGYSLIYTFENCPTYTWAFTSWSTCSVTCGGGTQSRTVYCQNESGGIVSDDLCPSTGKPATVQSCNTDECPARYAWQTQPSPECSASCGGGVRFVLVYCQDLQTGGSVSDILCEGVKPPSSEVCNAEPCPTDGVPACGSRVSDATGTIQSPGYPAAYDNNVNCIITFDIPADTRIKFTINVFSLEEDTSIRCERDYLKFESLPSGNTALYCKQYFLPLIWESSAGDNEVRVEFYSNDSGTEAGYSADWEHV
ncbi:uncharacterized protein [Ptychodera flava]|uniref:uncharacterized protein isoform X5 n=1 Tax=Ptychodera flava TaxID=63121 RepID=UPI003969BE2F